MKDVVDRISDWLEDDDFADANQTLRDARAEIIGLRAVIGELRSKSPRSDWAFLDDEIFRLKERLKELRAAADQADAEYQCEIASLRLTDAEREAIAWAINKTAQAYDDPDGGPIKREAMRGLLQRPSAR
jgi:hypothetical protein